MAKAISKSDSFFIPPVSAIISLLNLNFNMNGFD